MELYATPLSHFARKARIILSELSIDFTFRKVETLLTNDKESYGGNPLLTVPVLRDGDVVLFDSDVICEYLCEKFDKNDFFGFQRMTWETRNTLSVINAVMGAEVALIISERSGMENPRQHAYFQKIYEKLNSGLYWLDEQAGMWPHVEEDRFPYTDVCLICMWEHLAHYQKVPLGKHRTLVSRIAGYRDRMSVIESSPTRQAIKT